MHGKSKEKTEINSEKELIETATVQAIGKNRFGNITVEELQKELEGDATVKKMRKKIVVTINESQRMYYVDENGNVYEYENHSLDVMEDGIDFYNRIEDYRDKIITVSVIDNMDVPENVYKVLDVSKKQNQSIKAWMVENIENKDMYDLYIGGNDGVEIENCSQLFSELQNCININLENLYTENVIDFSRMFYKCTSLKNINLENLNARKSETMNRMFAFCSNLKKIDLSNFETTNLTDMGFMFYGCSSLESIDLSTFNTSKVIDMTQLFNGCKSIKKLNLENLDVKLLKGDMKGGYYMFADCSSLEELNISNWDVSNITLMNGMFKNCSSLQILDLSGWNIEKVINVSEMFDSCTKLKTIYISDKWGNNSQVQNSGKMFFGCVNLSGAIKFEANKIDITYANYKTGYFTYKEAK